MSYRPSYPGDKMATTEGARRANVRPVAITWIGGEARGFYHGPR